MWVETDNDQLVSFKDQNMENGVGPFSTNNKVQCPDEVGEYLIENYPSFHNPNSEVENEDEVDESE